MALDPRQLQAFRPILYQCGLGRAAEALRRSQPALGRIADRSLVIAAAGHALEPRCFLYRRRPNFLPPPLAGIPDVLRR